MGTTAQPWCTGPAHFFVGVGANLAPVYFGTTEGEPVVDDNPDYEPLMNDLGGSRKPFDFSFQGIDCVVSGTFTRWKMSALRAIESVPRKTSLSEGRSPFGDLGTFMVYEGGAFPIWLVYPYSSNANHPAMTGLPAGRHFLAAFPERPIRQRLGTRPMKVSLTFYCARVYSPLQGGVMTCYDLNLAGLPAIE